MIGNLDVFVFITPPPPPTDLRLRHHGVVAVAQRRELQPLLPLRVALLEELLHAARGPLQTTNIRIKYFLPCRL